MTSGAGLKWKVIRMWDYPMIKHNSYILRVPTDFGEDGRKFQHYLKEIFLPSYLDYVEEDGYQNARLSGTNSMTLKKKSLPAMVRIVMGMRIINNPSFKMIFMTSEIQ